MVLEGDSKVVVASTHSREEINADYGIVIEDVRSILANQHNWSICFTYREVTNVAHMLAKLDISISNERVLIEDGLMQIIPLVLKEKYCNH